MKYAILFLLFALPVAADGPSPATPSDPPKPVEKLTVRCYRDGQPAKFTGRTKYDGYECEFSHDWQGRKHTFWWSCRDARKTNMR